MFGKWRSAKLARAQARWGARPAGGTLYTGTATIAVTCGARPPVLSSSPAASAPPPPPSCAALTAPPPPPAPARGDLGCPGAASAAGGRAPRALAQLGFPRAGCMHRRRRLPHGTWGEHTNHTRRPAQVSFVSPALPSYPPTRKVEAAGAAQTARSSGLVFVKCRLQGGTGQAWQVPGPWCAGLARRRPGVATHCPLAAARQGSPGSRAPAVSMLGWAAAPGCLLCVLSSSSAASSIAHPAIPGSIQPDLGNSQLRSATGRDIARDWVSVPVFSTFLGTCLFCLCGTVLAQRSNAFLFKPFPPIVAFK